MMMQRLYKTLILLFIAGISTGLISCEKYNEWETDESSNRLFRPSEVTADVKGVTVTLKWKAKPNTNSYTIELSKDSLEFKTIEKTFKGKASKNADGYSFTIPELLDPVTRYSARIKGTDTTATNPESQWSAVTFKTATEQIMFPVTPADLTINSVKLRWNVPNQVTHIMIGATKYDISAEEKSRGEKTIAGLTPETAYTAVLHLNNTIRGSQIFSTPADLPAGPNVVYVTATDDLATMIQNVTSGTTFVLLKGSKYTTDTEIVIPEGVSFSIWGQDGVNKPILAFNGFKLPASAGTIKFENIDFTGYQDGDASKSKRNYIFNQSASSNTAEIVFENCVIRNLVNTPMRLQSANPITIDRFRVNRCVVYDIGDNGANGTYAFVHSNVATGKINNISITNSTFYKIGYGLILHNLAPSTSVVIENNTFNNTTGNTRYFIDYNAQAVSSFSLKNNIIGKTLSPAGTARGLRAGTAPTVINTYKTNDAAFSANPIPNIVDYTKASNDLFTSADSGNFRILDNSFEGKSDAGDPRWRP